MKKFTLFDFVNDNSLQIGETSWIQDLPSDDHELQRLLKPNEHVLVNWPVGERKTEKHLVKVVYMSDDPQELVEMMQKILRADEITKIQVLGKCKRKRIEMIFSESEDSDLDKEQGKMMKHIKRKKSLQASAPANILSQLETSLINKQREPYSGGNFLYSESSSDDEEPLFQLSKVELCAKIKSLKRKLTDTMRENCRLRQSLVMLQVLPQAVTHFEELVGMAEALLKGGVTSSASSLHSHAVWKASHNPLADSYAAMHSNSSSPITLNVEDEEQQTEKQFKIEKWQIALCNKSKPQKFINDLMQALYTHEYMATHSLTGAKSSSSKDKAAKPAMNQNEVQEIIGVTKQLFPNTDDALIRRMMGQKLNNCTKKPILSKDLNSGAFQKHSFCSPSSNEVQRGVKRKFCCWVHLVTTYTHKLLTFKTSDTTAFISSLAATSSLPTSSAFPQNTITTEEKKFGVKSNKTDKSPSQIHKAEVKQRNTFNVNMSNSVINCLNSGSTAAPQGIISSAVPPSTRDQQDDDSPAANAQLQQSDSCLTPLPPPPEGQKCLNPTYSKVESQLTSNSPAPSPNQSCRQDLRNSDKE